MASSTVKFLGLPGTNNLDDDKYKEKENDEVLFEDGDDLSDDADICRIIQISGNYIINSILNTASKASSVSSRNLLSNNDRDNNSTTTYMERRLTRIHNSDRLATNIVTASDFIPFIDFTDPRSWHVILHFSNFILGGVFMIMTILLILRLWQIPDYTDRTVVRQFMKKYINPGWSIRGGIHMLFILIRATITLAVCLATIFCISKLFTASAPDRRIIGAFVWISVVVVIFVTTILFFIIRGVAKLFQRYVSQNINYTSAIILKRVVKSKVELGLALLFLLFCPVLYKWTQALILLTDWNDALTFVHRRTTNYFVPCYVMAFPPYREQFMASTCPVARFTSPYQDVPVGGFYTDYPILQCDTYLGYAFFTVALIGVVFAFSGIFWMIYRFVTSARSELWTSRWFPTVQAVLVKYNAVVEAYQEDFDVYMRWRLGVLLELRRQRRYFREGGMYAFNRLIVVFGPMLEVVAAPIICIGRPIVNISRSCFTSCRTLFRKDSSQAVPVRENTSPSTVVLKSVMASIPGGSRSSRKESESSKFTISRRQSSRRLNDEKVDPIRSEVTGLQGEQPHSLFNIRRIRQTLESTMTMTMTRLLGRAQGHQQSSLESGSAPSKTQPTQGAEVRGVDDAVSLITQAPPPKQAPNPHDKRAGLWREDLTQVSREKEIHKYRYQLNCDFVIAKREFTTDHVLAITVFDVVIDTAGILMITCQFCVQQFDWVVVILFEMSSFVILGGMLNYYLLWQERAGCLLAVNIAFGLLTYAYNPFSDDTDKWIDWLGRVLIGLVVCGQLICASLGYDIEASQDATPSITALGNSPVNTDGNYGIYVVIDLIMTGAVYAYVLGVMDYIGVFEAIERKVRDIKYGMHDHVLDVLVDIARDRIVGYENLNIGLSLIQQWDDIIRQQRKFVMLAWPDVRPPRLLTLYQKLVVVKWAGIFNLNIENLRTSFGLTLLHAMMCSASTEVVHWLVHNFPQLMAVEDAQRDTPLTIALKECALYLTLFSKFNDGRLEDLTTYADDEFDSVYPEVYDMREEVLRKGEFVGSAADVYTLNPREANEIIETGAFKIFKTHPQFPLGYKKGLAKYYKALKKQQNTFGNQTYADFALKTGLVSRKNKNTKHEKKGVATTKKRYPEDSKYEDFESGQLSSWTVLNIHVPDNNIDLEDYTLQPVGEPVDMRQAAGCMSGYYKVRTDMKEVDWYDPDLEDGAGWRDYEQDIREDRKEQHRAPVEYNRNRKWWPLKMLKRLIEHRDHGTEGNDQEETPKDQNIFQKYEGTDAEIRWRICRFAEIMANDEIARATKAIKWNTVAYKDFNKAASQLQGVLAQHLAVCFHLHPPAGFSRLADWTVSDLDDVEGAISDVESESEHNHDVVGKRTFTLGEVFRRERNQPLPPDAFNDRIIQYLAEIMVSSTQQLDLSDSQLSGPARIAWRAICRAVRRRYCSFVIPSMFISPKAVTLTHLYLPKNELDCGDALLIADVVYRQQTLVTVDLAWNRIGARGLGIILQSMRSHLNITVVRLDHNRIGPAAGRDIGVFLKKCKTVKVFSLSHNRLGELIRFSTSLTRDSIRSAVRDIFVGMRANRSLHILDVSYNHLGVKCADYVPLAVMRHPVLKSINLSGNDIGPIAGPKLLWKLAGKIPNAQNEDLDDNKSDATGLSTARSGVSSRSGSASARSAQNTSRSSKHTARKSVQSTARQTSRMSSRQTARSSRTARSGASASSLGDGGKPAVKLAELCLADNHLGPKSGVALGTLIRRTSSLTALDVSGNSLGTQGATRILNSLMEIFGLLYSSIRYHPPMLIHLNLARNGLGSEALATLAEILEHPSCTLNTVDFSGNPLGRSTATAGGTGQQFAKIRRGLGRNMSLERLDISNSGFVSAQLLPIFGAVSYNKHIRRISFANIPFDEPCCLMLAKAIEKSPSLEIVDIPGAQMGPKGGSFVFTYYERVKNRIRHIDVTDCHVGALAIVPLTRAIKSPSCVLHTLLLANNGIGEVGGKLLASALMKNRTITNIDLSMNNLTTKIAEQLADDYKILVTSGQEVIIRRILFNDNPLIGHHGAKHIVNAFSADSVEYLAIANIGAGPQTGLEIARSLRDVTVAWKFLDISRNKLSRTGLNDILWALRRNRRLRELNLGSNIAGTVFGSPTDTLGEHGVALPRAIQENLTLRRLDLSHNAMSSDAAINVFIALRSNMCIQSLSLRGNVLEDQCAEALADFMLNNDVVQDLDLGHNQLGYEACFALAEGIARNRAIKILCVDGNILGSAGPLTTEAFWKGLCYNFTLRILHLDGNRLGNDWAIKLADAFARNCSLVQVSMKNNRIDDRGGKALLRSYQNNNHLSDLLVTEDEVGTEVYKEMQKVYIQKQAREAADEGYDDEQDLRMSRQRKMMFPEY